MAKFSNKNVREIGSNGNTNIVWEDLRFPASTVKLDSTNPPTETAYKSGQVLEFPTTAINLLSGLNDIPSPSLPLFPSSTPVKSTLLIFLGLVIIAISLNLQKLATCLLPF